MRITFTEGRILLVSVMLDDGGKPRLDVDLLRAPEAVAHGQLEVPFDVLPE
jgi:hypothetical protein